MILSCYAFHLKVLWTCVHAKRAGEITQTVSSWFILASHVGQFIKLLHSDAPTGAYRLGIPLGFIQYLQTHHIVCWYVLVVVCICVLIHLFLSPCLFIYTVCWIFHSTQMYYICISGFVYIFHLYVSLSLCVCACLCVAFEMCRGSCLSLCIRQSSCHDRQRAKKRREEWERRQGTDENRRRKRDSNTVVGAGLELDNCFRADSVCVFMCACFKLNPVLISMWTNTTERYTYRKIINIHTHIIKQSPNKVKKKSKIISKKDQSINYRTHIHTHTYAYSTQSHIHTQRSQSDRSQTSF